MNLNDRAVLITGASRGLGQALAWACARAGARVALVARGAEALEAVAAALRAEGHEAHAIVADMGDKGAITRIAGEAAALVGPIDLLVLNASALGPTPMPPLLDTECEDLEHVLAVNVVGPFRLAKAVVGSMALRGEGVVVAVSSDAAVEAYPTWGAYGASKAAMDHLVRIWGAELERTGVRLLSVDPGEMDTAMHAAALPDADPAALARPADVAERILRVVQSAGGPRVPAGARVVAAEVAP